MSPPLSWGGCDSDGSDYIKKVIIPLKPDLDNYLQREAAMPCFYLTPKKDDFNQIPELQVGLATARVR